MTEANISATPLMTPLADLLQGAAAQSRLTEYRGVLTVQQFDAAQAETAALVSTAGVYDLGWLGRVAVRGEDRFRWLSGMVTNTVQDLKAGTGAWNLVLNAQGRIQGDVHLWRSTHAGQQDALELELAANQQEKLLAHFDHFIIMDDVELVPLVDQQALGLSGPLADEVLAKLEIAPLAEPLTQTMTTWNGHSLLIRRGYGALVPNYELWVASTALAELWQALQSAGAVPVGTVAVDALRIAEGVPAYGIDMVERDLPQETSQLRALHFNKGCYLGQEIVERIRSRGNVHRHLRQLELTGTLPEAGTELTLNDAVVGNLTSVAELGALRFALGMIRAEAEAGAQRLHYSGGTAEILSAPPTLNSLATINSPSS